MRSGEEGRVSSIRFREAASADAPAMTALIASLPEWFTPDEIETVRQVVGPPGVVAVADDSRVIGMCVWEQRVDEWEICWLAVARNLHRRGVGRRMLAWMLQRARRARIARIRVQTVAATTNCEPYVATRAFYEACGFELDSIEPQAWPDGTDKAVYVLSVHAAEEGLQ